MFNSFLLPRLQVICLQARPNFQRLHSSRCCALSLNSRICPPSSTSMSFCQGLPLPLFPSISLCREFPLRMCSIQFFCLVLIGGGGRWGACFSKSLCPPIGHHTIYTWSLL